jgi:hypothetical protein
MGVGGGKAHDPEEQNFCAAFFKKRLLTSS